MGGWHDGAVQILHKLAIALARSTGQEEGEVVVVKHLFGRLSILLMRGNSALLLNRVPSHPDLHIDGDI